MGNALGPEEELRWSEECKRLLFNFEINNAEFAEFGGSWKGLYDYIKNEDAEILALTAVLKAELDKRPPAPPGTTTAETNTRDSAIVDALQSRMGRAMLLEFRYVALQQFDSALDLAKEVILSLQKRQISSLKQNPRVTMPFDDESVTSYIEYALQWNPDFAEAPVRMLVENVLEELPMRYQMPTKIRFGRVKAKGFDVVQIDLPWLVLPGYAILTFNTTPTEGPPGFGGRVPAIVLQWKTAVHAPYPIQGAIESEPPHWVVAGFILTPQQRKPRKSSLGIRLQQSSPTGGNIGTPPPSLAKRGRRPSLTAPSTPTSHSNHRMQGFNNGNGTIFSAPVSPINMPKSSSGDLTTPPSSNPKRKSSPRRAGPLTPFTHYFLDNNVLVSLARGDPLTVDWAKRHEGKLFCSEVAKEEHLSFGRMTLPPQVIFVESGVNVSSQERAIKRILASLSLSGNTAEKLKPDLRYLIQSSWVCWDDRLGVPHDGKVAFITFNMKFWRRLLQHEDKLRLIEYIINDEGLEHLVEVACAQDYIGREPHLRDRSPPPHDPPSPNRVTQSSPPTLNLFGLLPSTNAGSSMQQTGSPGPLATVDSVLLSLPAVGSQAEVDPTHAEIDDSDDTERLDSFDTEHAPLLLLDDKFLR